MPQIPVYDVPKAIPAPVDLPNIPTNLGTPVEEAMQKAGAQLFTEGVKWTDMIQKAQTQAAVSKSIADATVAISDYRNKMLQSPEFNTDPGTARTTWDSKVREMAGQYGQGVPEGQARQLYQEHVNKLIAAHTVSFSGDVAKKQVEIVKGAGMSAMENFSRAAAVAPDDNTFMEIEKNAMATVNGMIASGALGMDDGVRVWDSWKKATGTGRAHLELLNNPGKVIADVQAGSPAYKGLDANTTAQIVSTAAARSEHLERESRVNANDLEKKRQTEANDYAYKYVFGLYGLGKDGGSFSEAEKHVMDPDKAAELGLTTLEQRVHVSNAIHAEQTRLAQANADAQKKIDVDGMNKVLTGKITADEILASPMSPEKKEHAIGLLTKADNQTDRATWDYVFNGVTSGQITDPSDIMQFKDTLSKEDIVRFTGMVNTQQDPSKNTWFRQAVKSWEKKHNYDFMNMSDASEAKADFVFGLQEKVLKDKLTGPAILDAAAGMFKQEDVLQQRSKEGSISAEPGIFDKAKSYLGIGASANATGTTKRRELPPAPNTSGMPEIVGTHTATGLPAFRLPDGSLTTDPREIMKQPIQVGVSRSTGKPIYMMPDGSYSVADLDTEQAGGATQ